MLCLINETSRITLFFEFIDYCAQLFIGYIPLFSKFKLYLQFGLFLTSHSLHNHCIHTFTIDPHYTQLIRDYLLCRISTNNKSLPIAYLNLL